MNIRAAQAIKLYKFKKPGILETDGAKLPESYKKFYKELTKEASPVHYIPSTEKYIKDDKTGEIKIIQNCRIPLKFPLESHQGIWGGEAVIKGFQKRSKYNRRVPHFWVPNLKLSAVHSEILAKTMKITVTERTIDLIIQNNGFDHYILKTPANDLQSFLALKLKQKMLKALYYKDLDYKNEEVREEIYNKYKHYLNDYTEDDIEWYGLTFAEALIKHNKLEKERNKPVPLKIKFREELIQKLMAEMQNQLTIDQERKTEGQSSSWLSRIKKPFTNT